ncbi:MAG: hypothetical protein IJD57_03260 [Candidatus Gastranaerophilales bacterium]|nr:hypothetical protein [Candidatus Gastranaerophilales bacterium]
MEEKRIKIKSQMPLWQFILAMIVLFGIAGGVLYLIFNQSELSSHTRYRSWELIGFIFFIIPFLYKDVMCKKEYLSDIYITEKDIILVYKIRDKITKTKVLEKNNIKSFILNADINVVGSGKTTRTEVTYNFFIDLIEGQDVDISDISDISITEGNYKFIFRILDIASYIPNFKFNLNSNNEAIEAEIDYYKRFKKTLPFKTKFKMNMQKSGLIGKILVIICLIGLILSLGMMAIVNMPAHLTPTEKQYLEHIENSSNCKRNYDKALDELDKAKDLISTDPYLYYKYAYIFKRQKDYSSAIHYANLGISKLGNKEIYYKQYKFIRANTDIYLYELLGDCYFELKDWQRAIENYTLLINSKHKWKYSDVYFSRARAYFELRKYKESKNDLLKHKEIILDYLKTYSQDTYANTYTQEHLANIEKWIESVEAWEKYSENGF